MRLSTTLSGIAGEYFVAGEVSRMGLIAALTLKNTRGIDLLVSDHGGRSIGIQVKTNQDGGKAWLLGKEAGTISDPSLVYVLVNLNKHKEPHFHVVPSAIISETIRTHHVEWLRGTKRDGSARKDTDMREFTDREGKYRDAWHHLGFDL